jgi:hypothetical protein
MTFRGSCHCGRIKYVVDEDPPTEAMECNCSICRKKGYLHHFTTPDKFSLEGSRDDLTVYEFNKHVIRHQFCRTCGAAPFAEGTGPGGQPMTEINLRCADDLDLSRLKIVPFDGASR